MAALLKLSLSRYQAEAVLLPGREGAADAVEGLRITVFGDRFPIRAIEPEILVGEMAAQWVEVARDQRSIRGYFRRKPADGARIVVRYADSQEGQVEEPFQQRSIQPLPVDCQ